ncbi:MAG: potassium channel family protein [Pontiella sp.]
MSEKRSIVETFLKGRFSMLLISLATLFFISPLIPGDQTFVDKMFGMFILAVLISCIRAISRTRRFFIGMMVFTLINLAIGSYELFSSMEPHDFGTLVLVVRIAYFSVVFISIMRYVLDASPVTGDKICGAISAYLVMGIVWTFVYTLFYHLDASSFKIPEALLSSETVNSTWAIYFSFTTLTTLGYGDITPQTPGIQSYAIMEAACGQIFMAVIVARLIALHITQERNVE